MTTVAVETDVVGGSNPADQLESESPTCINSEKCESLKLKRKLTRGRITRAINRVTKAVASGETDSDRFHRELEQIHKDYDSACEYHGELYEYIDDTGIAAMDDWETALIEELFEIEKTVENYIANLNIEGLGKQHRDSNRVITRGASTAAATANTAAATANTAAATANTVAVTTNTAAATSNTAAATANTAAATSNTVAATASTATATTSTHTATADAITGMISQTEQNVQFDQSNTAKQSNRKTFPLSPQAPIWQPNLEETVQNIQQPYPCSFDNWIDDLIEFRETELLSHAKDISIADALYRLETSRDIPAIQLTKFNGDPLLYVDFIERFKIHIHDKLHLSDDMRMIQLKMHLAGGAERAIAGMSSSGVMYHSALKTLKGQFGQPSVIVRAFITRLTKGQKIPVNNKQALRDLSLDIINCLATFHRISFFSDVNANENLRQIIMRLPDYLIRTWKNVVSDIRERGEVPNLEHISRFLQRRVNAEFDPDFGDIVQSKGDWRDGQKEKRKGIHSAQTHGNSYFRCYICQDGHRVSDCPTFVDSTVMERIELVKKHRLCFNCLIKNHMSKDCRSKKVCEKNGCTRTHHPLLHTDQVTSKNACSVSPLDRNSIMPVVRVLFRAPNGRVREGNVLVDSGAGTTIVRSDFAKALGLQGKRESIGLSVVGGERIEEPRSRRLKFHISGLSGGEEFPIEAHEISKTILSVPALNRPWLHSFSHLSGIEFSHKAGPVDLILGVQYSHLHVEEDVRQGLPFEPVAKRTRLGWYVIGADNTKGVSSIYSVNFVQNVCLEKFYEFETLGIQAPDCSCPKVASSPEDRQALKMFEESCTKESDRYVIGLPWKEDPSMLPDNFPLAEKRLISLEKSLLKNPAKAQLYDEAIMQYEASGWACRLTDEELKADVKPVYYLPHHGVYRPDKPSTPLRVVFDPACQYKGVSLNSLLYKGPGLIGNLLGVLLRFREDYEAFVGDISKMFLQIRLPEEDTHVHRFLWRNLDVSKNPSSSVFRLLRVTFGDKPSPDMASFVMLRMAEEHKNKFPYAAKILQRDRYMDDLIHSCTTHEEAWQRMNQLNEILATGSFNIKEWYCTDNTKVYSNTSSSDVSLVSSDVNESMSIPAHEEGNDINLMVDATYVLDGEEVKTLGLGWRPKTDMLKFLVRSVEIVRYTKRTILSKMSMLYDPLGLASAVTIKARMAMQDIWRSNQFDWDDPLPDEICEIWQKLFSEIENLVNIEFPRCIKPRNVTGHSELHIFSDASATAYGAVAYLLWPTADGPEIRLVAGKARVAPLKQTTIPRLELMAAVIASRLGKTIFDEFKEKPSQVIFWSDSQIVLHWLHSESITLKAFVGVRVAEIQATWDSTHWRYVPTKQNPADDLSRGLLVEEISKRWMHGPAFLREPKENWPVEMTYHLDKDPERKTIKCVHSVEKRTQIINPTDYSDWNKLVRITAYCFRFIHNMKHRCMMNNADASCTASLQPEEIEKSEQYWFTTIQSGFSDWQDQFRDLAPFLDNNIIRVGGRLRRTPLTYDQIHPVLLPSSNHVSKLIMRDTHVKMGHVGPERTLCESRRKFWFVRGRNLAKQIVHDCVVCRKLRQKPYTTLMADLPPERLKPFSPPYLVTGVDLFGPFRLKFGRNKSIKAWGALFTCANVRAIFLEIVENLSTQAFLQALRRFVARHGWPSTIISDNGTSFVGAQKELKVLVQEGRKQIEDFASLHKVKWLFSTPLSPHQGGFYESLIKLTKRALQNAIGQQLLSWNEMSTAFAEVECLVNSRPIGFAPNDPNDLQPLTPNHFVIGRASTDVPQGPFQETKNLRKRFEFIQMLVQQFWKRFIREYVPSLTRRLKWQHKGRQFKIGDVVLLTDPATPRGKWNLARVIEVFPGSDGIIRNIRVKTKTGEYKRSVQRCCPILEAVD